MLHSDCGAAREMSCVPFFLPALSYQPSIAYKLLLGLRAARRRPHPKYAASFTDIGSGTVLCIAANAPTPLASSYAVRKATKSETLIFRSAFISPRR